MAEPKDDDAQWWEALAGRTLSDISPEERRRIETVRAVVKEYVASAEAELDVDTAHKAQQLLFRVRREGLLKARPLWQRPAAWIPLAAAAALVLGLSVAVLAPERGDIEGSVIRGGEGPQIIETRDVDKALAEIVALLERAGVKTKTYPIGAYRGLEADVPPEQRAALRGALQSLQVKLPEDGRLRIELRRRP